MLDLNSRQGFDSHMRIGLLGLDEHGFVVRHVPIGVQASHGMNFINIGCVEADVVNVFLDGHRIGVGGLGPSPKSTEPAGKDTNVGLVNMDVRIEEGFVAKSGLFNVIRQRSEFIEVGMLVESHTVLKREWSV